MVPKPVSSTVPNIENALANLGEQTVLCVGDVMLDEFVYGDVTRISPEAPTPVLAVQRSVIQIGGAGNVARNIAALGAQCILVSLIGNDDAGLTLTNALGKFDGLIVPDLVIDKARQTTRKVRFVSEHHSTHLMRADWETTAPTSAQSEGADHLLCRDGHAAGRRRDAVGLRQGHADTARHPRHHRRGAAATANRSWSIRKATITAFIAARH